MQEHPKADLGLIRKAHLYASALHDGQLRQSGEPFYHHPLSVAGLLAAYGMDLTTVAAGLLVDAIEEGGVTSEEIEQRFGRDLAYIVEGVTKIGRFRITNMSRLKADHYRRMIIATSKDLRVLIVRLADCCVNMRTLNHLQPEQQVRISQEVLDVYAPLAHRIGMNRIKSEMEHLAFSYLDPESFEDLEQQIIERTESCQDFFTDTMINLRQTLQDHGIEANISSRVKSHYSISRKMEAKNRTLDGIYDYFAFRITVNTISDCYRTLGLLHGKWRHIPGRIKDFIATPKENLYQSLHTTLISDDGTLFEVQIRTREMHRIADMGIVAHWDFEKGNLPKKLQDKVSGWFRQVAEENKHVVDNDEFLDNIKDQLQIKNIVVFTPRSDVKMLPTGSTPLDFAYLIHSEVGNHAVAALVNGERISLRAKLKNGDIVEIVTDSDQTPVKAWLDMARTPSARAKIGFWLRREQRRRARAFGKIIFDRELMRHKKSRRTISNEQIEARLETFGLSKIDDFFMAIANGVIMPARAVGPFLAGNTDTKEESGRLRRALESLTGRKKVLVRGQEDPLFHLSRCCHPIIGDPIVGIIHKDKGIYVHRNNCRTLKKSSFESHRLIELEWSPANEFRLFKVSLEIKAIERDGMLADISKAIARTGTSISQLHATSGRSHKGTVALDIKIHSPNQLDKVFQNLKEIDGILSLKRK